MTLLLLIMAAILPSKIDCDKTLSRYFLPYQVLWIRDDARLRLVEKSVRIGWTWGDAFKNVRKRLHHKNRDYLFATRDQGSALEYVETCYKFCELYNFTKSVVSHGVEDHKVPVYRDGKDTGFTEEVKMGVIRFDNGSRILAFSSNPNAMRVYGGDVGLDEFAFHPAPEPLWETAQGRITWGYDLGMWSAHNGTDTLFYVFSREAAAGKGGWSYYRVTMEDALELGLLEKINGITGKTFTKEEFIQDCRNRARLPEVYEQAYNCNPSGSTSAIVPWGQLERCLVDYEIERVHLEETQIRELFGEPTTSQDTARENRIATWLQGAFAKTLAEPAKNRLGYDVAASGKGDLASVYLDRLAGVELHLRALLTFRTADWNFHRAVLRTLMRRLPAVQACGDETGLGRNVCWDMATDFPGQFTGINFGREKHDLGFRLMNQLSAAEKKFPRGHRDIAADYFALRKHFTGGNPGKWVFSEGANTFNPHSHCDIAWSGALASRADTTGSFGAQVG